MQQPQQSQMTLKQKSDLAKGIIALPSFSVIVFLRRRIGFRILDSGWYFAVAVVVYLVGVYNFDPRLPFPHAMEWYALAIAIMGAIHRAIAWFQLRRGTQPHSYSTGISWFAFRSLPGFVRRSGAPNWLFDPLFTVFVGGLIHGKLSPALGNWLFIAAFSTLCLEIIHRINAANRDMDIADGLIMAEVQSDSAKQFRRGGNAGSSRSGDAGISTGLGADLKSRVRKRHK